MPADALTLLFTPFGRPAGETLLDLSLGSLRGIAGLEQIRDRLVIERSTVDRLAEYPPTQGPLTLLNAFARLRAVEQSPSITADCMVATHGALDGLAHALVGSGASRALYAVPGFPVSIAADRAGIKAVPISWSVDAPVSALLEGLSEELARDLGRTAVVVNFPANPSGSVPTVDEWLALSEITYSTGAVLVVDDVYWFASPTGERPALADHIIVVDSVSKRLGLPGLRLGYVATTGPYFAGVRQSAARTSVGISPVVADLGTQAVNVYCDEPGLGGTVRAALAERRAAFNEAFQSGHSGPGVVARGASGLYGCIVFDGQRQESAATEALRRANVLVTPGSDLSPPSHQTRPFIRYCLGSMTDPLDAGQQFVSALQPTRIGPN